MNPIYKVRVVKFDEPLGTATHALLKCPRCLRGIGITDSMLAGKDSIICKGALGETGTICNGHYYFDHKLSVIAFIGSRNNRT